MPETLPLSELPDQVGVLVLGGGLAGAAALLTAAERGQFAVLLEGADDVGGSTVKSAGLSAFAGTDEQAAQGIEDSVELLREDLLVTGRHLNQPDLVDLYCREQLPTYRWLRERGIVFGEVHAAAGQSTPRSHPTDSTRLIHVLMRKAGELGARVVLKARAVDLHFDGERVVGAEVQLPDGIRSTVRADAVVIATGGFSRNPALLRRWAPHMTHALAGGAETCQGDGLVLALRLGAGLVDTEHVKGTYG
ncbi:MAG: FAD-dependent oxidoreductase, partial [Actinomycetota bacterium]